MAEFQRGHRRAGRVPRRAARRGLLVQTGASGVYGRGRVFEDVRAAFDGAVTRASARSHAESMRFPPLLPRDQIETNGYLTSFPHLAGSVFSLRGDEAQALEQDERAARTRTGASSSR